MSFSDLKEPLTQLFNSSRILILNFDDINDRTDPDSNIRLFFEKCEREGLDPKTPENRQAFNNNLLEKAKIRYLVSRYAEDRSSMISGSSIANEGRVYHLGIDIFSKNLETVYSPCDGQIVRIGEEPENHSFGHYLIIQPANQTLPYIFLGHLGSKKHKLGHVKTGEVIAKLGSYKNHENGGWSRHLHIQMLSDLPDEGKAPIGYSSKQELDINQDRFPNPFDFFQSWELKK